MEQETKFTIKDKETADKIWELVLGEKYGEVSSPESIDMFAVYYDTPDNILKSNNIAFRTRREGDFCFATLKWGSSKTINGLFEHQEVNIPVDCDACFAFPPVDLFEESIDGKKLAELVGEKNLREVVKTDVTRRRATVCFKQSVVEIAIDQGSIIAGDKTDPISEIEIELFSGTLNDVLLLTDKISNKFNLEPENRSKYARGLALLEN